MSILKNSHMNKLIDYILHRLDYFVLFLVLFLLLSSICNCQTATFYHDKYEGRKTASGDIFHQYNTTCASNDYPFGTILRIGYKGKFVDVRVNDRMVDSNVIDLSKYAFSLLADTMVGRLRRIKIDIIKK